MKKFLSVLLAVMMVLSTVSFAAPSLAGTADAAVEMPAIDVPAVEEATAVLAADVADYGNLIADVDFEGAGFTSSTDNYNGRLIENYTSVAQPTLPDAFTGSFVIAGNTFVVGGDSSNHYLGVTGAAYPHFALRSNGTGTYVGFPNGYYTITADCWVAEGYSKLGTVQLRFADSGSYPGGNGKGKSHTVSTTPSSYTIQFKLEDSETSGMQKATALDSTGSTGEYTKPMQSIGIYYGEHATTDTEYADNFKVYWRPLTVDVTVDAGDNKWASDITVNDVANDGSVKVSDLVANIVSLDGTKIPTGIIYNNTTYALTDAVTFDDDVTTVTAVWESVDSEWYNDEYGTLLFKTTWDKDNNGNAVSAGAIDLSSSLTESKRYVPLWSTLNPGFGLYSKTIDTAHISHNAYTTTEIVYDDTLKSNVFKGTVSGGVYPQINYNTRYGLRSSDDLIIDRDVVITTTTLFKDDESKGATFRYNGFNTSGTNNTGGDVAETSITCVDDSIGNGWKKWVGVWKQPETHYFDTLKLHINGTPAAGTHAYIDDVCVYVKPQTVTLTIDNSEANIDNITISDYDTTGMTVEELIAQIPYVYGYALKGLSRTEGGEYISGTVAAGANTVLYADWEKVDMAEWESENGQLIFEINFDSLETGSAYTNKSLVSSIGKVNPSFPTSVNSVLDNDGGYTTVIKERATGDKYLEYTGASGYAALMVYTNQQAGFTTDKGSLVLTFDVFNTTGNSVTKTHTIRFTAYKEYAEDTPSETYSKNQGTWEEYRAIYDEDTIGTSNHATKIPDITEVGKIKFHGGGVATTDVFGIDNIRLYYLPEETTLTIKNTTNDLVPETQRITVNGTVALSDLEQYVKAGKEKYDLIGWSYEDGGELIEGDTLTLGYPTTIYPVWAEYNYKYCLEFNDEMPTVNDLKANTNFAWNSYGSNVTSDTNQWGTTVNGTIYGNIKWAGGYNVFTMKAPDAHTGVDGTRWSYGTQNVGDGKLENLGITKGTVKEIQTRVRYRNVPDFSSCSADGVGADGMSHEVDNDGNGVAEGSIDLTDTVLLEFNCQFVGDYWSGALQVKGDIVEGEWVDAVIDVSNNSAFNNYTLYGIFMDPTPFMWNGMIMEVDYVRLVSTEPGNIIMPEQPAPEYAPTTSEDISYRTSAPNGIRFKATLDAATNDAASDYGWVVGRAVKGATEETLVIGATSTITAYGRENNVNLKNFFEETDDLKTFTAVVYNIPKGNEDDVLCIKPFVKVDGEVFYGKMISKSPRQVAEAAGVDVDVLMKG